MAKKASFREAVTHFDRLRTEIPRRFAPLYLLMGEEGYFIDALCDLLAESILPEEQRAFGQVVVYGRDVEAGQVINLCRQMPMMGEKQVVIVREAQQMRGLDKLALYTASPSPTTVLVLCHKEKNVDKRLQFYKQIEAGGAVFESPRPYDNELVGWLGGFVRSKGGKIEPKAIQMLLDHLGTDIAKISGELQKLLTYLPEGVSMITADHVERNIGISKDFNTFELTRALATGDTARAMRIADHFGRSPRQYPFVVTLSALFGFFQKLFILNYQLWLTKTRRTPMPSEQELCRMMKLPTPYFLQEYRQAAPRFPNRKVFHILGYIRDYDLRSKGMGGGSAGDGELLNELMLKIILI